MSRTFKVQIIKPIFHCNANSLALGVRVGGIAQFLRWYLKTLKFALPPTQTPSVSRWNIDGIGYARAGFALGM